MLNDGAYLQLAGRSTAWDEEIRAARGDRTLAELQEEQYDRGRRSAELVHGIHGWYVRAGTSLMEPSILAIAERGAGPERDNPLDGSLRAALVWGCDWAWADPEHHEFYVRRGLFTLPELREAHAYITGRVRQLRRDVASVEAYLRGRRGEPQ